MACEQTPTCTCNICNPTYTELGCCDYISTDCVVYKGEDIDCLDIVTNENLTQILEHLQEVVCALTPGGYGSFDFGCFASEGITTEQEFVEFISATLCEVLGTQVPGGITSLSDLYALIQSLTVQVNLIKNQSVIACFQTLSGLTSPEDISVLLTAIQTIICDLDNRITALEGGSINTPITAVNFEKDVNIDVSGLNNHTITANVVLDPDSDNALSTSNVGLMVLSPEITVVDSASINLSRSGVHNHTITADVRISATAGNAASLLGDGVYVADATTSETPLVATDSTSIAFSQADVNGHDISADIILDPSLLNIAQVTANGLLVSSALVQDPITPIDTNTIDLTVTGTSSHTLRADAIISPNANNGLVALGNGLFVDMSGVVAGWGTGGNAISSGNFLGTTNAQPLVFKTNNVLSGRISAAQTTFGYQSGLSNSASQITAFGYRALNANTTGPGNVAVGGNSLILNLIGEYNVGVGEYALSASTGDYNTAVGGQSLQNAVGTEGNTALGYVAGTNFAVGSELTGDFNTFLGYGAINATGFPAIDKSTAIGYNAEVSASNQMVLGGTGVDAVSVVVGATEADASAVMEWVSTDKGILPPRMTTVQKNAIVGPAEGLMVYDLTLQKLQCYDGTIWNSLF